MFHSLRPFGGLATKRSSMNRATLSLSSVATVGALLLAGCADLPPGETGVFGTNGAAAASRMAQGASMNNAAGVTDGSPSASMISATVLVITKHQATERQRKVAEERARVALAKIKARQEREIAAEKKASTKKTDKPAKTVSKPKKAPRYIAVDTEKDERTAPGTAKAVMIFDTETQEIVGNNVYDVKSTPSVGGTAKFDTYTAEYVGNGS